MLGYLIITIPEPPEPPCTNPEPKLPPVVPPPPPVLAVPADGVAPFPVEEPPPPKPPLAPAV